ncbi:hypothetical protein [Belnapia sp. F-4-1]|nr:hypothetical protein [Belnapia sp. F-4-1]
MARMLGAAAASGREGPLDGLSYSYRGVVIDRQKGSHTSHDR